MATFKNISLRRKLVIIQAATAFIAVLICCVIFVINDIRTYKDSVIKKMFSIARIVGANSISPLLFADQDAADKILLNLAKEPDILDAAVMDQLGKVFGRYTAKGIKPETVKVSDAADDNTILTSRYSGKELFVTYKIFQEKEFLGTIIIRAEFTDLDNIIISYLGAGGAVLLIGLLAALIISTFLQRTISNRLLFLVSKTEQVTETGNYSIRVPSDETDEIGILSGGFNKMLEQIEKMENSLIDANVSLEKRVAERTGELAESNSLLNTIFEASIDGILVYNKEQKISNYNNRFLEIWEIPGRLTASEDVNKVLHSLSEKLVDSHAFLTHGPADESVNHSYEVLELKDRKYFEWYALPQKLGNKTIGYVWSFRDITERKNLEEELTRSNEFAYIASHDLQEPLRTISGFTELLQTDYKGKISEEADIFINFISKAALRMQRLIQDLLDFSRVGKNKTMEVVDCNQLLEEILMDMEASVKESKAHIKFSNLPVLRGFRTELQQLFQNLISNALKFRKKDTIPELEISAERKDSKLLFAVKDNGIGINKKYFEKIFFIFHRLHHERDYSGTGIGLATCKKIVDLHRGEIWVESQPGEGSTFYFTIPQKTFNN